MIPKRRFSWFDQFEENNPRLRFDMIENHTKQNKEIYTPLHFDAGMKVGSDDVISEYREETFTPSLNVEADLDFAFGGSIKFGKFCVVSIDLKINEIKEEKNIYIQHVPFCASPFGGGGVVGFYSNMDLKSDIITTKIDNDTLIKLYTKEENNMMPLNSGHFKKDSRIILNLEYRTL